jgi:hypothetical protein
MITRGTGKSSGRCLRSEHPERVDQSPAELLTGHGHGHWLELPGLPDPLAN